MVDDGALTGTSTALLGNAVELVSGVAFLFFLRAATFFAAFGKIFESPLASFWNFSLFLIPFARAVLA